MKLLSRASDCLNLVRLSGEIGTLDHLLFVLRRRLHIKLEVVQSKQDKNYYFTL